MSNSLQPIDCSLPGSSTLGISWARILGWVFISFSRESSLPRDQAHIALAGGFFTTEMPGKPTLNPKLNLIQSIHKPIPSLTLSTWTKFHLIFLIFNNKSYFTLFTFSTECNPHPTMWKGSGWMGWCGWMYICHVCLHMWMNEYAEGCMHGYMGNWTCGCMAGWIEESLNDEWMNASVYVCIYWDVCVCVHMHTCVTSVVSDSVTPRTLAH